MNRREASETRVAVVGAGLAGSLIAALLADRGYQVDLIERRPDPRIAAVEAGRSINLALSHRGLVALSLIGLDEKVLPTTVPMVGRLMHGTGGSRTFQPYGTEADQVIYSVSRDGLNRTLLDAAEQRGVRMRFGKRVDYVDLDTPALYADDVPTGIEYDFIVGADGAYSVVRAPMQRRRHFDYSQQYLTHGYKELTLPPTAAGDFALEAKALHIWPRGGFMMIALPNADRSFTCTLFWPLKGPNSFESLHSDEDVGDVFAREFPDLIPLIPDLAEQYRNNPVGSLVTIRCGPWNVQDRVLLIGDAAHAVVPFYGQGMNASFEDCRLLVEAIDAGGDRESVFARFARQRRRDTDALAELAIDNYETMRARVTSRWFLAGRALGRLAHRFRPRDFVPLYTMVTFTSIPYSDAKRRWERQVDFAWRLVFATAGLAAIALLWFLFGIVG